MQPAISSHLRASAIPSRRIAWLLLAIIPSTALAGCNEEAPIASRNYATSAPPASPPASSKDVGLDTVNDESSREQETAGAPASAVPRKIIYDAKIDLIVESLNGLEASIMDLVKQHGGFLAESDVSTQVSTQRVATWRVRVPVDRFDAFVRAVGRLGEVRTSHLGSQDVTAEYFDIEARIRNKQQEEKRLLKHLADSTGKLEDILKVEAELSRVRGEVERMQGRLRLLANRADLSTVTITATELKSYKPPEPVTLSAQVGATFFRSLDALIGFGQALLLLVVALAPWLPVIALIVLAAVAMRRASLRAEARKITPAAPGRPGPS